MSTGNKKKGNGPYPKARKKMALGKGLEALIPDIGTLDQKNSGHFNCDIDRIHPNPYQPRIRFTQPQLKELAQSIGKQGILQPLLVRNADAGDFELIVGERRLRAASMIGLRQVPVILKDISDLEMLELSIVENLHRENLNPLEEADAYQQLIDQFDFTQEKIAERVGKSRSAITNLLRLRRLPASVKTDLAEGTITIGHARALLGIEDPEQQKKVWETIVSAQMSVRETEALIKRIKSGASPPRSAVPTPQEPRILSLVTTLSKQLQANVRISKKGDKGKFEIRFNNADDFERLVKALSQIKP
jgi:ParB family chromosome partitioning protein